ncbi:MAG TPA: hypothetical protein V6D29_25925 [Leptolyngbyaceae cyanobacterium]
MQTLTETYIPGSFPDTLVFHPFIPGSAPETSIYPPTEAKPKRRKCPRKELTRIRKAIIDLIRCEAKEGIPSTRDRIEFVFRYDCGPILESLVGARKLELIDGVYYIPARKKTKRTKS